MDKESLRQIEKIVYVRVAALEKQMSRELNLVAILINQMATKDDLNELRFEMEERMDGKFDSLQHQINSLKGAMESRFDRMDERFILLEVAVKKVLPDHEQRIMKIENKVFIEN